eukprot:179816-Rhodomonas_salina.1
MKGRKRKAWRPAGTRGYPVSVENSSGALWRKVIDPSLDNRKSSRKFLGIPRAAAVLPDGRTRSRLGAISTRKTRSN